MRRGYVHNHAQNPHNYRTQRTTDPQYHNHHLPSRQAVFERCREMDAENFQSAVFSDKQVRFDLASAGGYTASFDDLASMLQFFGKVTLRVAQPTTSGFSS